MRISVPMLLDTALPRLRSTSWASSELRTAAGMQGWYLHCVSKMLMLQLCTRFQLLNTVVNIGGSQIILSKFPSPGSQLLKTSCSSKKANSYIRVWSWLEGISVSLNMHPAYILIPQPASVLSPVPWYPWERNMHTQEERKGVTRIIWLNWIILKKSSKTDILHLRKKKKIFL